MLKNLIGAMALMFAAGAAQAITYVGSLTAGATTANYRIVTDGTLGVLADTNIVAITGSVTSANTTGSIGAMPAWLVLNSGLTATATTLSFDFSGDGSFAFADQVSLAAVCLTGTAISCAGEPNPSIYLAANLPGDAEFISATGVVDIATAVVPEPAQWAMMIGGFGLAGAAMRRRRAVVAIA